MITPKNTAEFLDGLIHQELVYKRDAAISAFGRGLELLGLLTMIRQYESEMKDAFVYNPANKLTAEMFVGQIMSKPPIGRQKRQIYRYFIDYIHDRESIGMLQ